MSFILDALRKSEKERQQGNAPSISDVPAVIHDRKTPAWAVAVIAILSTSVFFLVWDWWHDRASDPDVAATSSREQIQPTPTVSPMLQSGAVRNLAREPTADTATATRTQQPTETTPVQAEPEVDAPTMLVGPPTIMEAIADGLIVPPLALELHVYSGTPTDRFVRINSASYREGEILRDGPRIETITEEGVILNYRGQSFLLSAD